MTRLRQRPTRADAEALAVAAFSFLVADPDRLGPFLSETGLEPGAVRAAAADPGFLPAVLDYVIAHEAILIDFAADQEIEPASVPAMRSLLPGGAIYS